MNRQQFAEGLRKSFRGAFGSTGEYLGEKGSELASGFFAPLAAGYEAYRAEPGAKIDTFNTALEENTYRPKGEVSQKTAEALRRYTPDRASRMMQSFNDWSVENPGKRIMLDAAVGTIGAGISPIYREIFRGPEGAYETTKSANVRRKLLAGEDPEELWATEGWGMLPGTQRMVTEMDDSQMSMVGMPRSDPRRLTDVIDYPELFDRYPEHKYTKVQGEGGSGGSWLNDENTMTVGMDSSIERTKSVIAHEVQHAMQSRYGHPEGSNPDSLMSFHAEKAGTAHDDIIDQMAAMGLDTTSSPEFTRSINRASRNVDTDPFLADFLPAEATIAEREKMADALRTYRKGLNVVINPQQAYENVHGEALARLVQARLNYSAPTRAATYPFNPAYFERQTGSRLEDLTDPWGEKSIADDIRGPTPKSTIDFNDAIKLRFKKMGWTDEEVDQEFGLAKEGGYTPNPDDWEVGERPNDFLMDPSQSSGGGMSMAELDALMADPARLEANSIRNLAHALHSGYDRERSIKARFPEGMTFAQRRALAEALKEFDK